MAYYANIDNMSNRNTNNGFYNGKYTTIISAKGTSGKPDLINILNKLNMDDLIMNDKNIISNDGNSTYFNMGSVVTDTLTESKELKTKSFFYDLRIDDINHEFYGNTFYGRKMQYWMLNEQSILRTWRKKDTQRLKDLIKHSCDNKCKPLLKAICEVMTDYDDNAPIAMTALSYDAYIREFIIPRTFKFIKAKPKHVDITLTNDDIEWMANGGIRRIAGNNSSRIASYTSLYLHKKHLDDELPDYDDIMSTYHWNDKKNGNPVDFIFSVYDSNELMHAKCDFINTIMNTDTINNLQSYNIMMFEALKHIPWLRASNNDNMTSNNDNQWFTDAYLAYNAYLKAMNEHYASIKTNNSHDDYMEFTAKYVNEASELLSETQLQPVGWLNTEFTMQNVIRPARMHEPCYAVSAFIMIAALFTFNEVVNEMNIELCNDDGFTVNGIMSDDIGFIAFDTNDGNLNDDAEAARRNRMLIKEIMGLMFTDYPYEYIIERIKMLIMNTPEYEALNLTDGTGKQDA